MTVLTIYCCGTSSNSHDASKFGRKKDQWDAPDPGNPKQTKFDLLMSSKTPKDRSKATGILNNRKNSMIAFGTNPYFQGEIVSTFANQHSGKEFADWIQIDGPGSGNLQDKILWTEPGHHSETTGQLLGYGLQELASAGRQRVVEHFDLRSCLEPLLELFRAREGRA
jgi:hypothetical protein